MQKLTKREEQIMQAIWSLDRAFIKQIIEKIPSPKPHYNSIATIIKILEDKSFLTHEVVGNVYQYYALVSKESYQATKMKSFVAEYFDNSFSRMFAFFAKEQHLSTEEVNEIINIIKSEKS